MTTEKKYYFIDGIEADRASKKLMRRHVMKGKNAGKTFHRPSRVASEKARRTGTVDGSCAPPAARCCDPEGRYVYWMHLSARTVVRDVGDMLLPISLPVEVTPQSLKVINQCKQVGFVCSDHLETYADISF
jgi:hypothetical protein